MKELKDFVRYCYKHHVLRYLFVGGSTFLIDFTLVVVLHGRLNMRIAFATTIAYWISIIWNFSLNRWWTFDAASTKSLKRHLLSYTMLLLVNYLFTVIFVTVVSKFIVYTLAKIISTAIQIVWTYPIYKHVIFTKQVGSEGLKES